MMISARVYRGIEFIRLTELPQPQQDKFLETFNPNLFIKILIDEKVVANCVQYKDYSAWYKNVYGPSKLMASEQPAASIQVSPDLVLQKP